MVDALFSQPRLAALYDPLDPDRSDLEVYAAMAEEFGVRSVLDIGSAKPFADRVRWIQEFADALPPLRVDLVTMTGNVAQVFLSDPEWTAVLGAARAALRPGGRLVFETRDPARQAWREWNRADSRVQADVPGVGGVEAWHEVTEVSGELVSFQTTYVLSDGAVLTSDSTLRFRSRDAVLASLAVAGFTAEEIRGAPDRPGREFVFVATRAA